MKSKPSVVFADIVSGQSKVSSPFNKQAQTQKASKKRFGFGEKKVGFDLPQIQKVEIIETEESKASRKESGLNEHMSTNDEPGRITPLLSPFHGKSRSMHVSTTEVISEI